MRAKLDVLVPVLQQLHSVGQNKDLTPESAESFKANPSPALMLL